jgi:hypothetical protein
MYQQQPEAHLGQEEDTVHKPSHSQQGGILPLASQPVNGQDAEENEKHTKITAYLADRTAEISHFTKVLVEIQSHQKVEKIPQQLCQLIDQQLTLERHIQRLQEENDDIRWQVISRQAMVTFSDSAVQHLLDIQGQVLQAVGALTALGSSLALSLLFTAARGDMWCMYGAYWLFTIGLAISAALGLAGSGINAANKGPSRMQWTARRWSLLGTVVGAFCVIGGFLAFCVAVVAYDLTEEIETGKAVITGPRPGNWRDRPALKVFEFAFIGLFASLYIGVLVRSLRPSLRLRNWKLRRNRRLEMFDASQSTRPVMGTMLSDILDEGSPN